jgi:nucleoside-diphosphate-sugar epimerase
MSVLVTGASGFLGGRLAEMLVAQGTQVRVLARSSSDLRRLQGPGFEIVRGAMDEEETLARAVRGVTHIYHCAGCSTDWAPWQAYHDANVAGVRNLLRAAAESPHLERFLHVSTTDVYGYPLQPCEESHPITDIGLPYNRSKCMGETLVRQSGIAVTIVRPATIYGPRGKAFTGDIAKLLRQHSMAVIDGGRSRGGFCYVDNAAQAMIDAACSSRTIGQIYNLADGTGATWRDYVDALAHGLGLRRPWIDIPAAVAFRLARAMEAPHRYLRIPGRPPLTRHAVYLLSRNQEYPTEKARQDFGFAPSVRLEEGIARSIEWLRASRQSAN